MEVGILDILQIVMIFQLVVFSFFLIKRGKKFLSNYILGVHLLSQAIGVFGGFCGFSQFHFFFNKFPHVLFIGTPLRFYGVQLFIYMSNQQLLMISELN